MTKTEAKQGSAFGTRVALAGGAGLLGVGALVGAGPGDAPVAAARHLPPVPHLAAAPPATAASTAEAIAMGETPQSRWGLGPQTPAPAQPAPSGDPAGDAPGEGAARFADAFDVSTFQKGNIHTHTNLSDGDHPPEDVYLWYRERGYAFLAITDHNTLTEPSRWQPLERKKRFVMITGEEVTMRGAGKQVHVNALCHHHTIGGKSFDTQRQALAWAVKEVTQQGGVALVNHPNWDWALTAADLPAATGARLLEIESGHPYVHTLGDAEHLSHEAIWDTALTAGQDLAGVAVDDAHIYGPRAPDNAARPGRAWIQVAAAEPTRQAICAGLSQGRLYASTGPSLRRIAVKDGVYTVAPADASALVEFVGRGGRVLQSGKPDRDGTARYRLTGGEGYVRARVTAADGKHAWTQPSRVVR